jgi:hypothetical protein
MLVVVADGYDNPLEPSARRDRFTCTDFYFSIADNEKSGIVVLLPERRALIVSGPSVGYVRIRVMDGAGLLVGAMSCGGNGHVAWTPGPSSQRPTHT